MSQVASAVLRAVVFAMLVGGAALLLALSLTPGAGAAAALVTGLDEHLLDFPPLPDKLEEPWQRSVVLDREGNELAILRDENRKIVALETIPEHVIQAVLATEDADFYHHDGVNWRAVLRAAAGNVAAGEITSGGSTITQQVIKNFVLTSEQTLDRKLQEAVYAVQLERRLGKDQILELYLNDAYFGNRVYGIGTAAEFYWGKDVSELTVAEGALLAGIIRLPEGNEPIDNPDDALARRNIVLSQMAAAGYLSQAEAEREQQRPIELDIHPLPPPSTPFFVDYVRSLLRDNPVLGETPEQRDRMVLTGGLTIRTTLDPSLQEIAQEVIGEVLNDPGDPLAALVTVNPMTGEILTVGFGPAEYGNNEGQVAFNPAVPGLGSNGRQPGSAFKAFQIVTALEAGISPGYTFAAGARYEFERSECRRYRPGNYADASQGLLDMADATARSSNTYFAHLLDLTGPEALVETAQRMGITSPLEPFCSLVLGAQNVFPLEMASAFGTFAAGGVHCEPYALAEITDRTGRVLWRGDGDCREVIDAGVAARATDLLRGPIERGTASRHGRIGRPAAGKTGTTDDYHNAWFAGFIPQLSTAVWVGHEIPEPMTHPACGAVTGGCLPTMVWQRYMALAVAALELPVEGFPAPPPIPRERVPNVVGLPEEDALARLEDAGFRGRAEVQPHWAPAGTVFEQEPGGGGLAAEGSMVLLSVSDGSQDPPPPETSTARPAPGPTTTPTATP